MNILENFGPGARLFTYKVMHDAGTAPNPYSDLCTLAICKPAIRRVAKVGDVVVGLAGSPRGQRIVYCMVVEHSVAWASYISMCNGGTLPSGFSGNAFRGRVPSNYRDPGDCIWVDDTTYQRPLPSLSNHSGQDEFESDVLRGRKVLISSKYWYFGGSTECEIYIDPVGLDGIIPGRGHKSNANEPYKNKFVEFFNGKLIASQVFKYGRLGTPLLATADTQDIRRKRCRALEVLTDDYGEDGCEGSSCVARRRC